MLKPSRSTLEPIFSTLRCALSIESRFCVIDTECLYNCKLRTPEDCMAVLTSFGIGPSTSVWPEPKEGDGAIDRSYLEASLPSSSSVWPGLALAFCHMKIVRHI